ncbi:MAG: hypothetical protein WC976_06055 [Caldisericia bacterium]
MKKISKKEARKKYGIITTGANSSYSYFLRKDGCVVDNDGDVRFVPKEKKMEEIELGALKRIIEEVKEYRKLPTNMIGGNDIDLVEKWIKDNTENQTRSIVVMK